MYCNTSICFVFFSFGQHVYCFGEFNPNDYDFRNYLLLICSNKRVEWWLYVHGILLEAFERGCPSSWYDALLV